jgi:regulator of sirC expression with transglutaminase-like and TPR domain
VTELEKYLELVPKAPNADKIKQAIEQLKKG